MIDLRQRWEAVQETIEKHSSRHHQKVEVIAISKKKPFSDIEHAYSLGLRSFGENYVQEALLKVEEARKKNLSIHWHYVGSIQSNKLNKLVANFDCIHAIDSISQIEKLDKIAAAGAKLPKLFIQLNLANESTKSGIKESEIPTFFEKITHYHRVEVSGLMTFPPYQVDPENNRPYFAKMMEWKSRINGWKLDRIEIQDLSMGVSSDYPIAIEEGATLVRLGETIFGPRLTP